MFPKQVTFFFRFLDFLKDEIIKFITTGISNSVTRTSFITQKEFKLIISYSKTSNLTKKKFIFNITLSCDDVLISYFYLLVVFFFKFVSSLMLLMVVCKTLL